MVRYYHVTGTEQFRIPSYDFDFGMKVSGPNWVRYFFNQKDFECYFWHIQKLE